MHGGDHDHGVALHEDELRDVVPRYLDVAHQIHDDAVRVQGALVHVQGVPVHVQGGQVHVQGVLSALLLWHHEGDRVRAWLVHTKICKDGCTHTHAVHPHIHRCDRI